MNTNGDFLIISRSVPRMGNVSEKKSFRGNQNTFYVLKLFFSFKNRAFYEIMRKNIV